MFVTWEQRKLGEVGKAQSGVGFPDREQGGKTGVPFYKVSDMNNAGNEHEMCTANNYVSEAQCKKNGWTPITEISVVFAKVGAAIMLNRKRLVRISFLLDNNTMAYKFGTEWNIDFGKTLFERIDLTDLVQIGALPSYNATDVECVEISMPDKPEQHRIGVFFKQLDNLITLHQRKQNDKFSLFKPKNYANFLANSWEQRKLGEVANIQKGQQLGKAEMSNNGAFYVLNGGMEPSGYTNQYNTFANTISISEGGNSCGYVSLNLEQFWSGGHNYTLQNPRIDTFFLYQWLKRHEKGIMALRVGSGLPNIQKSALQDVIVAYPKKSEQRAIAEILNKIDNLITLHQRKYDKIVNIKKALLEKMFPAEGEEVPKIRFKGFTDAWEQRKLGDVFDYERPDAYIVKSDKYSDAYSIPVLTANKGFILGYTNEGKVCTKECIIFDDFTLDSKYVTFPFMVKSSALKILTTKIGYYLPFAYELLQSTKIEVLGHARHYISVVQPTLACIPSYTEQTKIGECIQQLDNLITLHQRGLIKIQGDKKWQKRKFQKNCSAIILNAG